MKEQLEKVERNNRQLKDKLTQFVSQDVHLIGNRTGLQPIESTSYNGTLKWKLDDFTRRFQDAVAGENSFLLSPPFCTRWEFFYLSILSLLINRSTSHILHRGGGVNCSSIICSASMFFPAK